MTVAELIELLRKEDQDRQIRVLIDWRDEHDESDGLEEFTIDEITLDKGVVYIKA